MTLSLKHTFVSDKSDDADTTLVRPSNWNAEHTITLAANKIVGAITAGVAVEIDCTSAGRALIDDADAAAQRTTLGLTALATTTPGTNVATFLATPTSANLAAALTDETGSSNTIFGYLAGFTNTSGSQLTAVGKDALFSNTTGVYNNAFGYRTLYNTTDGDNNCAFGDFAGFTNTTGNYNVFFGANAGFYETGSSKLYIDNTARASEAAGRANALVYGVFGTSPTDQTLQINGKLIAYGTPTNDSAAAGQIGEFIESTLGYSSRTTLTTSTGTNITSISLTAGDWDVSGQVVFEKDTTTTLYYQIGSLSTTSVTLGSEKQQATITNLATGLGQNSCVIPQQRISLASTTTVYLVAQAAFATSFCKAYGAIFARRAR